MPAIDQLLQRALPTPGGWLPTDLRRAAVLCPIVAHQGQDHLLFMMRPLDDRHHAGQIAFPGGMQEGEETPIETAVRECFEEVGMPDSHITPLGELQPRESTSRIQVHCIVARVAPFELKPDPIEVARLLHMPLFELRNEGRWREAPPPAPHDRNTTRKGPQFVFGDDLLWGLTARFVRELTSQLPGSLIA